MHPTAVHFCFNQMKWNTMLQSSGISSSKIHLHLNNGFFNEITIIWLQEWMYFIYLDFKEK